MTPTQKQFLLNRRASIPISFSKCQTLLALGAALFLAGDTLMAAPVQRPVLWHTVTNLGTSWFGAPVIYDLDGDGRKELITTFSSIYVWDSNMNLLHKTNGSNRVFAPAVVADLDRDGITEVVVGQGSKITAYEWKNGKLSIKAGWPYFANVGGGTPEVRGLAGADLDNNGTIEIIASNTQGSGPEVYVLNPNGTLYQPPGLTWNAWPRYNTNNGTGNDADSNGPGNHGYGCYGLNVGVGNLDDDPKLEIVVTFDNHQINVFHHDGVSMLASDYYRNQGQYLNNRFNWGQMIRWFDPVVESQHYHDHTGTYPSPDITPWCQWTASPCNVVDLNGDGRNEVVGVPNIEFNIPYETIHYSVMALEGSYGDGSRSARRLAGWENLPSGDAPIVQPDPFYPPPGIPAPTTVDINGDGLPEVIVGMNDGYIYAFGTNGTRLWRTDIRHGRQLMYTSEILVGDLNQDGTNELIFTTYGNPDNLAPGQPHGYLMVLDNQGAVLHDIQLPIQGNNGNGKGAPAAPTLGDLDGDGTLEIVVQTFDGNLFVYNVPGSSTLSVPWPTARGSYLRQGRSFRTGATTPPTILAVKLSATNATIDWKADPYTYQTLEVCSNLAVPVLPWTVLKAFSPPSNPTNRFIDSPLRNAAYYRVRAE
jgi:FG-GAP repeat.